VFARCDIKFAVPRSGTRQPRTHSSSDSWAGRYSHYSQNSQDSHSQKPSIPANPAIPTSLFLCSFVFLCGNSTLRIARVFAGAVAKNNFSTQNPPPSGSCIGNQELTTGSEAVRSGFQPVLGGFQAVSAGFQPVPSGFKPLRSRGPRLLNTILRPKTRHESSPTLPPAESARPP
jgi:hypothetical protein